MLCEYGCGQEAKYQFGNGKWCCQDYFSKCPKIREKNSKVHKGKTGIIGWNKGLTKDTDERVSNQSKSLKKSRKDENSYFNSDAYRKKCIDAQNKEETKRLKSIGKKDSIEDIKNKYQTFYKEEEIRYNPDKPLEEKEIQVHCKYNECENSKEKGGWFIPTPIQLGERIRQLESFNGNGGSYFYCSDECKNRCLLYGLRKDPYKTEEDKDLVYTSEEYETWRQHVKKLDNSECQICGTKDNIHVHHIIPKKLEPFFALDPVNGICLCDKCHYKYGHYDNECKTSNIARKKC